jgi:hypothetical protein
VASAVDEADARELVQSLALALQAAALQRAGHAAAGAFGRTRLGPSRALAYGAGPALAEEGLLVERVFDGVAA